MALIVATNREYGNVKVTVDDDCYQDVKQHKWMGVYTADGRLKHIRAHIRIDGCRRTVLLCKYLLGIVSDKTIADGAMIVGYRDGNILNHCKSNLYVKGSTRTLRLCGVMDEGTRYKGVYKNKMTGLHKAALSWQEQLHEFGEYATAEQAAKAFDAGIQALLGLDSDSLLLNFPMTSKQQPKYAPAIGQDDNGYDDNQ